MMKLTKLMNKTALTLAIICLSTGLLTSAFVVPVSTSTASRTTNLWDTGTSKMMIQPPKTSGFRPRAKASASTTTTTTTQLQERKYKGQVDDGIGRGIYIQLVVFGLCAWLFTIPPEFRRAYLCPADTFCQEEGSCTRECVTPDEWVSGIKDYYKNGGGIKWDFSIDPKTKAANQQKMDAILGNMEK
ncbi:MAG: hypothetical protein SGBAC_012373 [Bacillariaceae sp.]